MALIGTLVSFTAGTKIVSADVNSNFSAIRNAFNGSAVLNDTANTITVTHTFTVGLVSAATITMTATASKIVPGTTSFAIRNNADGANNLLISDAGVVTIRAGGVITAGGLQVTAGTVALGGAPQGTEGIWLSSAVTLTGGTTAVGLDSDAVYASDVTSDARAVSARVRTQASAYTVAAAHAIYIRDLTKGAGSAITNQYGIEVIAQTQGGTNYGVYINHGAVAGNALRIQQVASVVGDGIVMAGGSQTGSSAQALVNLTQTWNTSGGPTGILLDVTNTASTGASLLNLKVGTSRFSVDVSGNVIAVGSITCSSIAVSNAFSAATLTATTTLLSSGTATFSLGLALGAGQYVSSAGAWGMAASGVVAANVVATGILIATGANVIAQNVTLATNATTGFLYVATSPGTSTGVPVTNAGSVAICYDTTNNRLQIYNGAWRTVALA